jgi:superoxide dismutase, Cu-Zn family
MKVLVSLPQEKYFIMKKLFVIQLFCLLLCSQFVWMACSNTKKTSSNNGTQGALATLAGTKPDTTVSGTVQFDELQGGRVRMRLDITVPKKANQSVAVHIHENGNCGDMGKAAGGHWNPTNAQHGKWGSGSFHSGDIGNINLDANGKGSFELESDLWAIGGDPRKDTLNKSIIVHSGVDDYTSQPSGNSGERIGCGVIQRGSVTTAP